MMVLLNLVMKKSQGGKRKLKLNLSGMTLNSP